MVNKKYYCYTCDERYQKMMSVADFEEWGLQCDTCGQGFCEILDKDNKDLVRELKAAGRIKIEQPQPAGSMLGTLEANA